MRLELGSRVECTDATFGKLVDVVIDPISRRVAHLVVERDGNPWLARLVPIELARPADDSTRTIALSLTVEEARQLPPVHDIAYPRVGVGPRYERPS